MKTWLVVIALLVLPSSPTWAQVDVVVKMKAAVLANGIPTAGPCGAFQITKRVAWKLRASGIGLVAKTPTQTQCEGFSGDALMYRNGMVVDILIDSGGANGPTWNDAGTTDASLWRSPIDPGDSIGQVDDVPPNTGGGGGGSALTRADLQRLEDNIVQRTHNMFDDVSATLERMFGCRDGKTPGGENCATVQDNADAIRGVSLQVKAHDEKINGFLEFLRKPATLSAIITAVTTIFTVKKMGN